MFLLFFLFFSPFGKTRKIRDDNLLNFSGRRGAKECIFGNVRTLAHFVPFTLMVARALSLRRAALAGRPVVDRLVHQCFCSRGTARGDDRASSLKKRVWYSLMLLCTSS